VISSAYYSSHGLALVYACTHLVTLNIQGSFKATDYRLLCEIIAAAATPSLRAVRLFVRFLPKENWVVDGRPLANALASCKSLRFLGLGAVDEMFGSMHHRDLFQLLSRLPIELLGIPRIGSSIHNHKLIEESLRLLPRLAVILFPAIGRSEDPAVKAIHRVNMRFLKSTFPNLLFESGPFNRRDVKWPPMYHSLSREAQAIFEHGAYRALASLHY
jgi:hypothetical protein